MRTDEDEMIYAENDGPASPIQALYLRCRKYGFCLFQLPKGGPASNDHGILSRIRSLDIIASLIDVLFKVLGVLLQKEDVNVHGLEVCDNLIQLPLLVEEGELKEGCQFLTIEKDGSGDELFEVALLVSKDQQCMEGYEIVEFGSFTLLLFVLLPRGTYLLIEAKVPQLPKPITVHKVSVFNPRRQREKRRVAFSPDLDIDLPHAPLERFLIEVRHILRDQ